MKEILIKMSVAERIDYLESIAESKLEMNIRREYSEEEMAEFHEAHANKSVEFARAEEAKKAEMEKHKEILKGIKEQVGGLLNHIRKGYAESTEIVYCIYNQDTCMIDIYDQYGEIQKSRKPRPDERQNIINFNKVSNG